ncbi:hypothetical protein KKF34_09520 [Myxococcota bacterium]|nr:hypothetical protein [Myxococcota bacterium]MBU1380765.1 hypothetical protein [Myxococcota bacterium]MBU1497102.1 hypothetical protein [Myxococcota bacterium]
MKSIISLILFSVLLFSCDDDPGKGTYVNTPLVLESGDGWTEETCGPDIYPCPPYGTRQFQTVRNIPFLPGNAAAEALLVDGSLSADLAAFYRMRDDGYRMLMIATTTGWCEHCEAQMDTMPLLVEDYGFLSDNPEVAFLVVVMEDENLDWATLEYSGIYSADHDMDDLIPVTNDPGRAFFQLMTASAYPFNLYIDLRDMTIFAYSSALETEELFGQELESLLNQL